MKKHFELTTETKVNAFGITLFRIKATVNIDKFNVKVGDLGGWVERDANVYGNAWVSGNAMVYGDARVYGDAMVSGDAMVYGNAWVSGNAMVYGDAMVSGDAMVYGDARVYGDAMVSGDARVSGNARVYGDARVSNKRDICLFSMFGSRNSTTTVYRTKVGIEIVCGCFSGTLDAFVERIKVTHKGTKYEAEYLAICEVIRVRFGL